MIIDAPITAELLDAAPAGSWLVEDYGYRKDTWDKHDDGLWYNRRYESHFSSAVMAMDLPSPPKSRTLHHPSPVRVSRFGRDLWSWACRRCGDFAIYDTNTDAHDEALIHWECAHQSHTAVLSCTHCDVRLPETLIPAHLAADHGLLERAR